MAGCPCGNGVTANLNRPKADGIAWPRIAGYNDHILGKGKDASVKCANAATKAPEASPKGMVIVSNYELDLNPDKGVFC